MRKITEVLRLGSFPRTGTRSNRSAPKLSVAPGVVPFGRPPSAMCPAPPVPSLSASGSSPLLISRSGRRLENVHDSPTAPGHTDDDRTPLLFAHHPAGTDLRCD